LGGGEGCAKKQTNKAKAVPLHVCPGPESSRRLRLPDFKTIAI
jgi:hypothetical protein